MHLKHYTALVLACLCSLLAMPVWAQQATGSVKGHITTNDDRPAAWVTIQLKGYKKTASTDEKGHFTLKNIKPGTYELEASLIGYISAVKSVTVEENKTSTVDLTMSVSNQQLQEVIIRSSKGMYNARQGSASLRLNEPLLEAPRTYKL
ncbi:carboxypeptidase-like regulatory domain-containing protein [Paraflavitalea speifideaquila]|uniref:carboxypeptidase-like regulatory domain-containing protein n=1 Tax=Paraflavitalea speifideaquila TaxID=3076558 RepID=UPI0028E47BEB|nr:carboxypeptidase-like regulatory domain-containing protein [Paraflavitalea speifideiaquila]